MKSVQNKENSKRFYALKRLIDFSISLVGLIVLAPIILLVIFLVWLNIGWPIFYIQQRPGRYGYIFKIVKFRTMTKAIDSYGIQMSDQMRTTKITRFLRKTSLDELPEFFNVLKGDMSLVGPRPLLIKYLPYFTEREKKRYEVKPGITGLAQINGRHLLTWDERLELDVKYVENLSIWMDIKILVVTIFYVLRQKDVLAVSSETIPDFDNYRKNQLIKNSFEN